MQNKSNLIQNFLPLNKQIRNAEYDEWSEICAHRRRRSIRLKGYDYSSPGEYFITICTYLKKCIFGHVKNSEMILNECGKMVAEEWLRTADLRSNIRLDDFVVMPNHLHGIIIIKKEQGNLTKQFEQFGKACVGSVPTIVRAFKAATTKHINEKFYFGIAKGQRIWQRNYYEHVIGNEFDAYFTREYIKNNPSVWSKYVYEP